MGDREKAESNLLHKPYVGDPVGYRIMITYFKEYVFQEA